MVSIYYGYSHGVSGTEELIDVPCKICNKMGIVRITHHRYRHIMWIPFYPIKKIMSTQCPHCTISLEGPEVPVEYLMAQGSAWRPFKPPLWMYSGIVFIGLFLAAAGVSRLYIYLTGG